MTTFKRVKGKTSRPALNEGIYTLPDQIGGTPVDSLDVDDTNPADAPELHNEDILKISLEAGTRTTRAVIAPPYSTGYGVKHGNVDGKGLL